MSKLLIGCVAVASAADVTLVTFDGAKDTSRTWKEKNDPVMGGKSTGTFAVQNGLGIFDGEVVDVPFLKAPGFIKSDTVDSRAFPDISSCTTIDVEAKAAVPFAGFRLSFGTAQAPGGKFHAYGYKSAFSAAVGKFSVASIPIENFTDYWDDATGNPIKTCQDNKTYCPDAATLRNLETLSVWAEGVNGRVHLEIKSIAASGCSKAKESGLEPRQVGLGKGRLCPAIPTLKSECPMKSISDPEFEAVCVQRSEPAELQQRRCMPGEKAPYYKDSEGAFRCACCGALLWSPSNQFDQLPASNWPWPSFHSPPLNGSDGLPNVCHRGPSYGFFQRNATMDLGMGALGEVGCARCGAHLGDYFNSEDEGHDHYCIDGVCMEPPGGKANSVCAPTTPGVINV
jgi:peptide methionine sulfoxide reductase MsrB